MALKFGKNLVFTRPPCQRARAALHDKTGLGCGGGVRRCQRIGGPGTHRWPRGRPIKALAPMAALTQPKRPNSPSKRQGRRAGTPLLARLCPLLLNSRRCCRIAPLSAYQLSGKRHNQDKVCQNLRGSRTFAMFVLRSLGFKALRESTLKVCRVGSLL